MITDSTSEEFFEAKYRQSPDPWGFASEPYELDRYDAIMAALAGRYRRVFEPGCSIGVLTERLASVSDSVSACDISTRAVLRARERCRRLPNVAIMRGALPDAVPGGVFDLVVFSEIGYYFDAPELDRLIGQLLAQLISGGTFLAAHWLGFSKDHKLSGDQVHSIIATSPLLTLIDSKLYQQFRIDRWIRK